MRGNSVYFPDRVVPMLPERISNDLCSLKEGEERPCLAVRMVFDRHGNKKSHAFLRAMMRSAAKLSYEEAQAAIDGRPSAKAEPLLERRAASRCGPPTPRWRPRATGASRSISTCPERKIVIDKQRPGRARGHARAARRRTA